MMAGTLYKPACLPRASTLSPGRKPQRSWIRTRNLMQAATLPAWSIFQRLMGVEKVFVYKSSVSRVVAEMLQG